jgi:hypothetical protein
VYGEPETCEARGDPGRRAAGAGAAR